MAERITNRVLALCILRIIERYSDSTHKLTQAQIIKYLQNEFNMPCERKAIKNHVDALIDMGYDIVTPEDGGYYLRTRDFEDSELRLLIDSVLASRHISKKQAMELIEKLKNLSSIYFSKKMRHVFSINDWAGHDINTLFYNIEIISEAIENNKKIAFCYNAYGTDKKLHKKRAEKYIYNPYQMLSSNGRYYLIGNVDKYANLSNFRVDLISDIEILEQLRKAQSEVCQGENIGLSKYDKEHVYLFSGASELISMRIDNTIIGDVIDYFGKDFNIKAESETQSIIRLTAAKDAFFYWALQYGRFVTVLEPESLRQRLIDSIKNMKKMYLE